MEIDAAPEAEVEEIDQATEKIIDQSTQQHLESSSALQQQTETTENKEDHLGGSAHQILREILNTLRTIHRSGMYEEFSVFKLMAGLSQMIVLLCLLLAVWFLLETQVKPNSVLIALGFSAVFQLMALTLYIMHDKK